MFFFTEKFKIIGMVGNKIIGIHERQPSWLGSANNHYRPEGILALGSWHIEATLQSLAEHGSTCHNGTWHFCGRRNLASLAEHSQLKCLAHTGHYIGSGGLKRKRRRFTFRLERYGFPLPAFLNLNPSLLTLNQASECQDSISNFVSRFP